jgi:hypothetical protein
MSISAEEKDLFCDVFSFIYIFPILCLNSPQKLSFSYFFLYLSKITFTPVKDDAGLPEGPLLLNPESLLGALRAEVWQRNSEIFKSRYCISVPPYLAPLQLYKKVSMQHSASDLLGYIGNDARIKFVRLKGPKHDQIDCGFFYINQTSMGR